MVLIWLLVWELALQHLIHDEHNIRHTNLLVTVHIATDAADVYLLRGNIGILIAGLCGIDSYLVSCWNAYGITVAFEC